MTTIDLFNRQNTHFDIVQIGSGGNGGYIAQRLAKLISSLMRTDTKNTFSYTLVDLDQVEEKNLQRQPFLPKDISKNKARVLSERYGTSYQIPLYYQEAFIETKEALYDAFPSNGKTYVSGYDVNTLRILIGAVDNHASRKIMHEYFMEDDSIIYLDCGVDGIDLDLPVEERNESGYSGHCVVGVNTRIHKVEPVGIVFPDILLDEESLLPSQSCGQNVVSAPQRMQANEMAALITMGYLNSILSEGKLFHHFTNFNARTNVARSRPFLQDPTRQEVQPSV